MEYSGPNNFLYNALIKNMNNPYIAIFFTIILIFYSKETTIFFAFMVKFSMEKENRGKNMAIPKYQYIKDELKNKIISGQFNSGDKFYTEAELINVRCQLFITVARL